MKDPLAFNPWKVRIKPIIPPAEKISYDTEIDYTYLVDGYGNYIVFDECQDNIIVEIQIGQLNQGYYYNPFSPAISLIPIDCPCNNTAVFSDLINYNGYNLIDYDGSYLIDNIQYS